MKLPIIEEFVPEMVVIVQYLISIVPLLNRHIWDSEAAIFEVLGHEPVHVDQIGQQAKLPIEQISATLTLMELKGMVRQVGGMRYVVVREAQAAYHVEDEKDEA